MYHSPLEHYPAITHLGYSQMRELLEVELVLLPRLVVLVLSGVETRRPVVGEAHAVADKDDDVLGDVGVVLEM